MSFFFNGAQANVTISGSVTTSTPTLSASQTSLAYQAASNGGAIDIYTVPAGKTLYLFGWGLSGNNTSGTLFLNDGSTQVNKILKSTGTSSYQVMPIPIATYTTGQVVKGNVDSAASLIYLYGILQ